jgi:hypothetical protein
MAALAKARAAQRDRADMMAGLRHGQLTLCQVLGRADDLARRTRLGPVLRALSGVGPVRVAAVLAEVGVAEDRRLGSLGDRQRDHILRLVAEPTSVARPIPGKEPR